MLAPYSRCKKEKLALSLAYGLEAKRMVSHMFGVQAAESGMRCNEAAKQTPFVTEQAA